MGAQDKSVRITIVVDQASADKAKRAIIEITKEVDNLAKSVKDMGGFFGSLGGLKIGTQAGSAGTSSATQASHAGGAAGGVTTAVSVGTVRGAGEVRRATQEIVSSFKSQKDALKGLVDAQAKDVDRAIGMWGRLKRAMGMGGPQGTAGLAAAAAGGAPGVSNPPAAAKKPGAGPSGNFLSNLGGALGIPAWAMGGATAGATLGGAAALLYSTYGQNIAANNRYNLEQPMMVSGVQAQFGSSMGGNALAIRHGDVARAFAISQVRKSKAYDQVQSEEYKKQVQQKVFLESPVGMAEAAKTGRLGAIWDNFKSNVGAGVAVAIKHPGAAATDLLSGGMTNKVGEINDIRREDQIKREESLRNNADFQARSRQQLIENYMKAHPIFGSQLNDFYGGALGAMGLSRSAGISGAFVRRKDGSYGDSVGDFEERSRRMGISGAEHAGFMQQMGSTAGRGFFGRGAAILSPQAGGLHNAANIFATGAQYGGTGNWGDAAGFMRGIQGQIGRGGLDVTAGMGIANTGMGAMVGGRFQAQGGGGLMSTLMEASAGGTTGRDMRNARDVGRGFEAFDRGVLGGGIDPLQQALKYSTAMEVAGNAPWQTQKALADMDAGTMAEVMRNPNSAQAMALKSKGVTSEVMRDYFKGLNARSFARIVPDTLTDAGKQAYANFQSAGGSTSYMKGMVQNRDAARKMKGKKGKAALAAAQGTLDQSESDLASLFELGSGMDTGAARGLVKTMMAIEGVTSPLHGRGAHRSDSMRSNRGQAIKTGGRFIGKTGEELATAEHKEKLVSGAVGSMQPGEEGERAAAAAAEGSAGGGDLNATIDQLGSILRKFVGQLHEAAAGGSAGPPM